MATHRLPALRKWNLPSAAINGSLLTGRSVALGFSRVDDRPFRPGSELRVFDACMEKAPTARKRQ